jgi:hypothetical protein
MESIDDLLAQIKAEYAEPHKPLELKKPQSLQAEQLSQQQQGKNAASGYAEATAFDGQLFAPNKNYNESPENNLLAQLKNEFEEEQRAEEIKKQQQIREEQLRQEQLKQQQRAALKVKAQAWLKKINPSSEEGLWFEEFACAYPNKLEAALDYLQALEQTQP